MFLDVYGAALVIILAAVVVGRAICVACAGPRRWWAAPLVGLAALIVVEGVAIKLPGREVTADVIGLLVIAASVLFLIRASALGVRWGDVAVAGPALLAVSIPFVVSGRVGLQGVSVDNDTASHLLWAEGVRSPRMAALWPPAGGYPLGPHSLVAALGSAGGVRLDSVFAGLLVAVVPLTALVAAGVVGKEPLWCRIVTGLFCSTAFLVAAYYGEGAFKETIMAGLLLAFVVHLGQMRARWSSADVRLRWLQLIPPAVLVAGGLYTYSYLGLAWFGATAALWVLAEVAVHPGRAISLISRRNVVRAAPWLGVAAVLAVILVLPIAGQALSFFRTFGVSPGNGSIPSPLGNLAGPLSPYEMFGIWLNPDFRYPATNGFHSGEVAALALGVLVYGVLWSLRRRELLMPAAVAACLLVWWLSRRTHSPYVEAKALVIAAPLMMAVGLRALLSRGQGDWSTRVIRFAVAAVFCGLAAYSSLRTLRNAPVQAPAAGHELEAFHSTIGNSDVLFLGDDDYAPWQLRQAAVSDLTGSAAAGGAASARPGKSVLPFGQAMDFDSVDPADFDHFRYVVTTNTPYASQPYANFRLVARRQLYELWERTGPTVPRDALDPAGAPGAILDCRSASGRKLRRARGEASIMPTPVLLPGTSLAGGGSTTLRFPLPQGRWELSIQYVSDFKLDLSAPGGRWSMPAYIGRPGPYFGVGAVTGLGSSSPVRLTVHAEKPSFITGFNNLFTSISSIAATRIPDTRRLVPLDRACGKYVDWYRLR